MTKDRGQRRRMRIIDREKKRKKNQTHMRAQLSTTRFLPNADTPNIQNPVENGELQSRISVGFPATHGDTRGRRGQQFFELFPGVSSGAEGKGRCSVRTFRVSPSPSSLEICEDKLRRFDGPSEHSRSYITRNTARGCACLSR